MKSEIEIKELYKCAIKDLENYEDTDEREYGRLEGNIEILEEILEIK